MFARVCHRAWGSLVVVGLLGAFAVGPAASVAVAQPSSRSMSEAEFLQTVAQLDAPEATVRLSAADAIGTRGGRFRHGASDRLRAVLRRDPDVGVRAMAGRAIGRLGLREAVPDLIGALGDSEAQVRIVAAAALWRLPDPSAVDALIVGLRDTDASVREWCALAVGVTGDRRAAAPLAVALADTAPAVRLEAVRSLARLGDPVAMDALTRLVQNADEQTETRLEGVNALAAVQSPDKANALVRLLEVSDNEVRLHVIRALGQVGDALVIPPLRRAQTRPGGTRLAPAIREAISLIEGRAAAPAPAPGAPGSPG
jgi:HEAT repeat protein